MFIIIRTMGNLGRAGYGASLDGLWPYSYDSCDVGTVPNQTLNGLPEAAANTGQGAWDGHLSYLPGQRLSRCTCDGESHPGPKHSDGTFVGRSAPEIDVFEAQVRIRIRCMINPSRCLQTTGQPGGGLVSQSAQWAVSAWKTCHLRLFMFVQPFNHGYMWENTTNDLYIADPSVSSLNTFLGGALQQSTSVLTKTNQNCYEGGTGCYSVYGFEYEPGFDNAVRPRISSGKTLRFLKTLQYISWVSNSELSWTLLAAGMGPDPLVEISARPISQEPMVCFIPVTQCDLNAKHPFQYIIINLGLSEAFGVVDLDHLPFPVHLKVDYIRVYQPRGEENVGCDPPDFPTKAYINQYIDAYTNPNLTTWVDGYNQTVPRQALCAFRGSNEIADLIVQE